MSEIKAKENFFQEENLAIAKLSLVRSGARKLNQVAALIRGMAVSEAVTQLTFSKKRIANIVKECVYSAIANAENNHGLDVDRLYVKEAYVGKAHVMKRFRARARGRGAKINKPFSKLTIVLSEAVE
jgi:large subunit ribosomal protein L22